MSWIVDNAFTLYVLLGIVAAGLVFLWYGNRQRKYLAYTAGVLVVIGLVGLLTQFHISDSRQLSNNVHAMADAVRDGKVDDPFKHISKDFLYEHSTGKMTRDELYEKARVAIRRGQVGNIRITQFDVKELSRANKAAKVRFQVNPFDANGDPLPPFVTKAEFVLEGEQWNLKTVDFYKAFVDTDQKIGIPGF